MKVEERLKELGFEQSPYNLDQWHNNQLDVCVYVNGEGKITGVQVIKSWHLDIKSYSVYGNYSYTSTTSKYHWTSCKKLHVLEE